MKLANYINNNLKMLLGIGMVIVLGLAALLLLIAGTIQRNQIPTDPSEAAAPAFQAAEGTATTSADSATEENISPEAQTLFDAKVNNIENPSAIAKLLEVLKLPSNLSTKNPVEIQTKTSPRTLHITFDSKIPIDVGDVKALDEEMIKIAQQMLALIPDADRVQWVYSVRSANKTTKSVTKSFDAGRTTPQVQGDIKSYGASAKKIDQLLKLQQEIGGNTIP